ncbi:MAG: hypothetical protein IJA75_09150 [Oscillospiraceae bacterium]|nr:hypothetical protein [Oscillospiraceae bacterium]
MAKKNNIRSIRFSDEMMEMIESQAGDSFTAKFEALVTRCMWELPRKEEELRQIQTQIENQKERLIKIRKTAQDLDDALWRMSKSLQNYSDTVDNSTKKLETIIENM